MKAITMSNGTLRIEEFNGSNYPGGKRSFEAFSDGTRVVLGWEAIRHIGILLLHENGITNIKDLHKLLQSTQEDM